MFKVPGDRPARPIPQAPITTEPMIPFPPSTAEHERVFDPRRSPLPCASSAPARSPGERRT